MDPPYPLSLPEITGHNKPALIRLIERIKSSPLSFKTYQSLVLTLTFFAYLTYHATRKTSSIIKSALDPQTPAVASLTTTDLESGWEPFNGPNGTALLGQLDVAFLFVYAIGTFLSGHFGDRMDLREFLTIGMLGTGLFTSLFGVGYWANIHFFYYYLIIQMLAGLFQSTGWPSVVAVVGNWFGKKKRGLIMGVWNAHVSLGNIAGSVLASVFLKYGWGWSMVVPSLGIGFVGILVFLLLPVAPADVGAEEDEDDEITEPLVRTPSNLRDPVGFLEALKIPGVVTFALSLFFAKMVAYTFLYWLPYYISHTGIDGRYLSSAEAGTLSTLFDVGGLVGGILAGHISDHSDAKAITAATFMYCAIPALYLFRTLGHASIYLHVSLMFVAGLFVNAPYALITTAVSADLGTHGSLKDNSRALATVTAIIDGTGSVGAALGPLLTGYLSAKSWDAVFGMLIGAALVAGLLLTRLVVAEVAAKVGGEEQLPTSKGSGIEV